MKDIHMNPVKAGLVSAPEQYRWSSCPLIVEGFADADNGLQLSRQMVDRYATKDKLSISRR